MDKNEEKIAIEKCIRSFIIKSIHAIVKSRNGIVFNTNCVSEVGARNNMMVYVEEDPEISATIKQTLDANFPIHVQDLLSLEIVAIWPELMSKSMTVEVWQFRLDVTERLDSCTNNDSNVRLSNVAATYESAEVPVDDFRHLRLFEKLGTLLKSLMVITRLLPGYQLSRHQDPNGYQMCYVLRRGPSDLVRLGTGSKCHQVGRVFSGLAITQQPGEANVCKFSDDSDLSINNGLVPLYLNATVHFRTEYFYGPDKKLLPPSGMNRTQTCGRDSAKQMIYNLNANQDLSNRYQKHVRIVDNSRKSFTSDSPDNINIEQSRLPCRVKPAFAVDHRDSNLDELIFDPLNNLLDTEDRDCTNSTDFNDGDDCYDPIDSVHGHPQYDQADRERTTDKDICHLLNNYQTNYFNSTFVSERDVESDVEEDVLSDAAPLQLPFSTVGISGARLTHLFAELREHANLDLFQVPATNVNNAAQSSLFDADALGDELERHEQMLKEFDDFLVDFQSIESYGLVGSSSPGIDARRHSALQSTHPHSTNEL